MSMKKISKIISVLMIVMMIAMTVTPVFAETLGGKNPSELTGDASAQTGGIQKVGNQVITIISVIGSVVSVVVLIVLGIKYMMGSPDEKAEYKKTLMPYVIGASLVFAASAIAGIVFNFASTITST